MGEVVALPGGAGVRSDGEAGCHVCGDVGVPGIVRALDSTAAMATVEMEGETCAVAVDLVDDLKVGDVILVHAGVAIARVEAGEVQMGGGQ